MNADKKELGTACHNAFDLAQIRASPNFLNSSRILGCGTGPRGEKMPMACPGVDSQVLATILDPFRAIFADLGTDRLSET